jgi:hypothetical protein
MDLNAYIRDIPDFPKEGIMFKDITPLLADPGAFKEAVDVLAREYQDQGVTKVLGKGKGHERPVCMPFAVGSQNAIGLGRHQSPDSLHERSRFGIGRPGGRCLQDRFIVSDHKPPRLGFVGQGAGPQGT